MAYVQLLDHPTNNFYRNIAVLQSPVLDADFNFCFSRVRVEMARERRDGRDNRNRFDRRSPRRDDRRGGGGSIRKGIPPGRKTNYRLIVENMSSKTSWQVKSLKALKETF